MTDTLKVGLGVIFAAGAIFLFISMGYGFYMADITGISVYGAFALLSLIGTLVATVMAVICLAPSEVRGGYP